MMMDTALKKRQVWRASLIFVFLDFLGNEPMIQLELGAFQTEAEALAFGRDARFKLLVQTLPFGRRTELEVTLNGQRQVIDLRSTEIFTLEVVHGEERTSYRSKRTSLEMLVHLATQSSAHLHATGAVCVELYPHQLSSQALISSSAPGSRRSS